MRSFFLEIKNLFFFENRTKNKPSFVYLLSLTLFCLFALNFNFSKLTASAE